MCNACAVRRAIGLLAVAAALAGAAGAAAANPIAGTFGIHLAGTGSKLLDATWRVQIGADGSYTITRNGSLAARGQATVTGKTVVFADAAGPLACKAALARGTYTWALTRRGGTSYLVLTARHDGCIGRKTVLSVPLARLKPVPRPTTTSPTKTITLP